jgi:glutamine amidotransferase
MIAIIDYGAGNLGSVTNAIISLGYSPMATGNPKDVLAAKAVFFPGVGAAGDAINNLNNSGMAEAIKTLVEDDRPVFAVCVGLQVLLSGTEEGGWHDCLGLIPGVVKRLPGDIKVPHIGWNQVRQTVHHDYFHDIPDKANFYFVHSYYAVPNDESVIAGTTDYGISFCSAIIKGNLVATQFHPEKSGRWGLQMYANFLERALGKGKKG